MLRGLKVLTPALGSEFLLDNSKGWGTLIKRIFIRSKTSESKSMDSQGEDVDHPQWRLRKAILKALESFVSKDDMKESIAFILELWEAGLGDEGKVTQAQFDVLIRSSVRSEENCG